MANFTNIQITNLGRALQAKAQAGTALKFTRFRLGSGTMGGQQIAEMTNVIQPVMWLPLNKSQAHSTGRHTLGAQFNNSSLTTGFYFREWGVFAEDPDVGEIMYCYGNVGVGAEYIPAGGGSEIVEQQLDIITLIGNAASVSAVIDSSLVYVSASDFETAMIGKVDKVEGKGLSSEDFTSEEKRKLAGVAEGAGNTVATVTTNGLMSAADKQLSANRDGYGLTGGTGTAYTLSLSPPPTLMAGLRITMKVHVANTNVATLNVNNLGAKSILKSNGNALTAGNLKLNSIYTLVYDGSNFILQGEGGEYGTAGANDVLVGKTIGTATGVLNGNLPIRDSTNGDGVFPAYHKASGIQSSPGIIVARPKPVSTPPVAYGENAWVELTDPNFNASNIRSGVNIFGLTGLLIEGRRWANGSIARSGEALYFKKSNGQNLPTYLWSVTVNVNLGFNPSFILGHGGHSYYFLFDRRVSTAEILIVDARLYANGFKAIDNTFSIRLDDPAYVTNTGFKLPLPPNGADSTYHWIAIE